MEWLIANAELPLSACALHFKVSQAWLSVIIHSDIFQAKYSERLKDHFDERIIPLRDKLVGVSHLVLDKLAEKAPFMEDPTDLTDTLKATTKALGMGASHISIGDKTTVQINQQTNLSPLELEQARRLYDESCRALGRGATLEGESKRIPDDAPSSS